MIHPYIVEGLVLAVAGLWMVRDDIRKLLELDGERADREKPEESR